MPTQNQTERTIAQKFLSLSLLATYATKYGLDFSIEMSKITLNSATNMADYFLDGKVPKLGIGDFMLDKARAGVDWTLGKSIQIQKALKEKVR